MRRAIITLAAIFLFFTLVTQSFADLDGFLGELNSDARDDMISYRARLSAHFNMPIPEVHAIIETVAAPADAFMCLQLRLMTHKPIDVILRTYKKHKGNGWGVIARELGIKPGSEAFHALKNGRFPFGTARDNNPPGQGRGKGKEAGKNHGKGHNK